MWSCTFYILLSLRSTVPKSIQNLHDSTNFSYNFAYLGNVPKMSMTHVTVSYSLVVVIIMMLARNAELDLHTGQ